MKPGKHGAAAYEYGRNIQNMVNHIMTVKDREERNRLSHAIIQIMGSLNPHLRDINDFKHKLWDHLAIMSEFKLDIDYPYDPPKIETFTKKPDQPATHKRGSSGQRKRFCSHYL